MAAASSSSTSSTGTFIHQWILDQHTIQLIPEGEVGLAVKIQDLPDGDTKQLPLPGYSDRELLADLDETQKASLLSRKAGFHERIAEEYFKTFDLGFNDSNHLEFSPICVVCPLTAPYAWQVGEKVVKLILNKGNQLMWTLRDPATRTTSRTRFENAFLLYPNFMSDRSHPNARSALISKYHPILSVLHPNIDYRGDDAALWRTFLEQWRNDNTNLSYPGEADERTLRRWERIKREWAKFITECSNVFAHYDLKQVKTLEGRVEHLVFEVKDPVEYESVFSTRLRKRFVNAYKWAVTLAVNISRSSAGHAVILIESVKNGEYCFERADLVAAEEADYFRADSGVVRLDRVDREDYLTRLDPHRYTWLCSKDACERMIKLIRQEMSRQTYYNPTVFLHSKSGFNSKLTSSWKALPSGIRPVHNCLSWAKEKLGVLGVEPPDSPFSRVVEVPITEVDDLSISGSLLRVAGVGIWALSQLYRYSGYYSPEVPTLTSLLGEAMHCIYENRSEQACGKACIQIRTAINDLKQKLKDEDRNTLREFREEKRNLIYQLNLTMYRIHTCSHPSQPLRASLELEMIKFFSFLLKNTDLTTLMSTLSLNNFRSIYKLSTRMVECLQKPYLSYHFKKAAAGIILLMNQKYSLGTSVKPVIQFIIQSQEASPEEAIKLLRTANALYENAYESDEVERLIPLLANRMLFPDFGYTIVSVIRKMSATPAHLPKALELLQHLVHDPRIFKGKEEAQRLLDTLTGTVRVEEVDTITTLKAKVSDLQRRFTEETLTDAFVEEAFEVLAHVIALPETVEGRDRLLGNIHRLCCRLPTSYRPEAIYTLEAKVSDLQRRFDEKTVITHTFVEEAFQVLEQVKAIPKAAIGWSRLFADIQRLCNKLPSSSSSSF